MRLLGKEDVRRYYSHQWKLCEDDPSWSSICTRCKINSSSYAAFEFCIPTVEVVLDGFS